MMFKWFLVRKSDEQNRIEISESAAEIILKQWRTCPNAELWENLADGTRRLSEVVNRNDWRILKDNTQPESDGRDRQWLCDYGCLHPMKLWPSEKCGCREKYGVPYMELLQWAQDFYKINHSYEITDHMRNEFLRSKSLTNE